VRGEGVSLLCDASAGCLRPLVPEADRQLVFTSIHGVAHPDIWATRRMILAHFIWSGMWADIASWYRDCMACLCAKVTKQPRASVQPVPIPQRGFSHMHVDLVEPLPASEEGFIYLLMMVDRTTRWVETPLKGMYLCGHLRGGLPVNWGRTVWCARDHYV
jgi:hypothetical protein